ncbi:hypothetical protein tloyanaT_13470 [Thalassotalea loyana]|uniref:Uncharacterized protein n=1 Tax=Thalassotalea loyana TaxID=280483 RepID=A0ABQ6HAE6_9GAMM|nr:hypothetical protein [Thalassotalea loyana]GLX85095.1 hypothetical protein tloyanaT_13470 [Thalassotalea loyana]
MHTINELIENLAAQYNSEVDDYNQVVDHAEQLERENTALKLELSRVKNDLAKAAASLVAAEQVAKEKLRLDLVVKSLNAKLVDALASTDKDLLSRFKEIGSTPKKIRDRIKQLQTNAEKQRKIAEAHKRDIAAYRHDQKKYKAEITDLNARIAQSSLFSPLIYGNGDQLVMWPSYRGETDKDARMALLYMTNQGRGSLIELDGDNEAALAPAPKRGLRPSDALLDDAGRILRRFKKQNWTVGKDDLAWFEQMSKQSFNEVAA